MIGHPFESRGINEATCHWINDQIKHGMVDLNFMSSALISTLRMGRVFYCFYNRNLEAKHYSCELVPLIWLRRGYVYVISLFLTIVSLLSSLALVVHSIITIIKAKNKQS